MSETTKTRNQLLKKLLDILGAFDPEEDIYTHLAKPDNLKVMDEMNLKLELFDEVAKSVNEHGFASYELIRKMKRLVDEQ